MDNGLTGFNITDISELALGLPTTFDDLIEQTQKTIQEKLINPIGEFWFAPEAQEAVGRVDDFLNNEFAAHLQRIYDDLSHYMNQTANTWASYTGTDLSGISWGNCSRKYAINNDAIHATTIYKGKECVGFGEEKYNEFIASLDSVKAELDEQITACQQAIRKLDPFVDKAGNQQAAVQNLFDQLHNLVKAAIDAIIDGGNGNDGLKKLMLDANKEYEERGRAAAQAMNS